MMTIILKSSNVLKSFETAEVTREAKLLITACRSFSEPSELKEIRGKFYRSYLMLGALGLRNGEKPDRKQPRKLLNC